MPSERARRNAELGHLHNCLIFFGGGDFISIFSGGLTATSAFRGLPPEWSVWPPVSAGRGLTFVSATGKVSDLFKGGLSNPIKVPVQGTSSKRLPHRNTSKEYKRRCRTVNQI